MPGCRAPKLSPTQVKLWLETTSLRRKDWGYVLEALGRRPVVGPVAWQA